MTANIRLVKEQDELRYGVKRLSHESQPSSATRRSARLLAFMSPTSTPVPGSQPTSLTKRSRIGSSQQGDMSLSSEPPSTSGRSKRAARLSKETPLSPPPQPPPALPPPRPALKQTNADRILQQLMQSSAKIQKQLIDAPAAALLSPSLDASLALPSIDPSMLAGLAIPPPSSSLFAPAAPPPSDPDPVPASAELAFPELESKYAAQERVGEGSFGAVFRAIRLSTHPKGRAPSGMEFAVKRISPVILPMRIVTEIRFLRTHGGAHHVIRLEEVLRAGPQVSLVFPHFVHHQWADFYWRFPVHKMLTYMHRLLEALAHIHTYSLIHRDIKPTNCLFNVETDEFRLIDFGFAEFEPRYLTSKVSQLRNMTVANRAGTRGFRAPEVLLSSMEQTSAVDMWAAGVLLLSLLTARHPFFKSATRHMLGSLCEIAAIFGVKEIIELATRENMTIQFPEPLASQPGCVFTSIEAFCVRYRSKDVPTLSALQTPPAIFDLLNGMLQIDPKKRITAREALKHRVFLDAGFKEPTFEEAPV